MYQVNEENIHRLMEASRRIHAAMVASPLWELVKNDPAMIDWMSALSDVESQIKKGTEVPDASKR